MSTYFRWTENPDNKMIVVAVGCPSIFIIIVIYCWTSGCRSPLKTNIPLTFLQFVFIRCLEVDRPASWFVVVLSSVYLMFESSQYFYSPTNNYWCVLIEILFFSRRAILHSSSDYFWITWFLDIDMFPTARFLEFLLFRFVFLWPFGASLGSPAERFVYSRSVRAIGFSVWYTQQFASMKLLSIDPSLQNSNYIVNWCLWV